jgi:hypothetical protein
MGFVIAGISWMHPSQQQITVHLDQPLAIQISPNSGAK